VELCFKTITNWISEYAAIICWWHRSRSRRSSRQPNNW